MFAIQQASPFGAFRESPLHARGHESLVLLASHEAEGLRRLSDTGVGVAAVWQYAAPKTINWFCRDAERIYLPVPSSAPNTGPYSIHCLDHDGNLIWSSTAETGYPSICARGGDIWELRSTVFVNPNQFYELRRRNGATGELRWTYTFSTSFSGAGYRNVIQFGTANQFASPGFAVTDDLHARLGFTRQFVGPFTFDAFLRTIDDNGSLVGEIAHYNNAQGVTSANVLYSRTGDLYWFAFLRAGANFVDGRITRITRDGDVVWDKQIGIGSLDRWFIEVGQYLWGGRTPFGASVQARRANIADGSLSNATLTTDNAYATFIDRAPADGVYTALQLTAGTHELARLNAGTMSAVWRANLTSANPWLIRSTAFQ